MLNVDGEITQSESRNPELVKRDEVMYEVLPSVETVDGMIDDIIEQNELYHQEMAEIERTNPPAVCDISSFYSSISNNSTVEGNSVKIESLFIEEDDVETRFDSENLVVDSGEVTGVTPEFLSKIWSITKDQAATAIERNTQLNRQSSL